jgi:hypothetical protein
MSETINLQADDLYSLNNLYVMQTILQNMNKNIQLIEAGTIGKVLTVTNANLYRIAAEEYGDATQWTVIANANGLTDPMIEATLTLTLGSDNSNQMTITGIPASPQNITFSISGIGYQYQVTPIDTLNSIASNIASMVSGATSSLNVITFDTGTVVLDISVMRIINLVIPQQSGIPSGGIL